MLQLNPGEPFPVVRVLDDHTDTNTYFVRAVIKRQDGSSVSTIATHNLTDQGSRIFSKVVESPMDASPTGLYIFITTTVYEDSGYTTKSPRYGEQTTTYLVAQRWNIPLGSGGGGGINWDRLRQVIREVLQDMMKEMPKAEAVDFGSLHSHLSRIETTIEKIEMPESEKPEKTDLIPLKDAIVGLRRSIEKIPQPKETDIKPIMARMEVIHEAMVEMMAEMEKGMKSHNVAEMKKMLEEMRGIADSVQNKMPLQMIFKPEMPQKERRRVLLP